MLRRKGTRAPGICGSRGVHACSQVNDGNSQKVDLVGNTFKVDSFPALLPAGLEEEVKGDVIRIQKSNFKPMNITRVW